MIDFHAHVLPGIDDGSADVEESLELLHLSAAQGVTDIVAASHFYASKETPQEFLTRRAKAIGELQPHLTEALPRIHLGAEVYYFDGIDYVQELRSLCIQGTDILLLEMPFKHWSDRMIHDILSLSGEYTVLLAHIDRYLDLQDKTVWNTLQGSGVLFQLNASAFLKGWSSCRKAVKLLREGRLSAIGSDFHNLAVRRPNLQEAVQIMNKKAPQQTAYLFETSRSLLA